MADAGIDIGQLTADQQSALQQYTAVTNQEVKDAVPLLQRCQWNVQVGITIPGSNLKLTCVDCDSSLLRR